MLTFEKVLSGCTPIPDSIYCTTASQQLVQLVGGNDQAVLQKINQSIQDSLKGEYVSIEAGLDSFIMEYQITLDEFSDGMMGMGWSSDGTQEVIFNNGKYFTIADNYYMYTGGAHGIYGTSFFNFDVAKGVVFELGDLFEEAQMNELTQIGKALFREQNDIPEGQTLGEVGYWFGENDKFYLPENFAYLGDRLLFLYNVYEVAAYAMGAQQVEIPIERVKHLMKE